MSNRHPRRWLVLGLLGTVLLATVHQSDAQDLFERAQQAVNVNIAVRDTSGVSIRGGINMATGTPQATTIFRGSATMGGSCGAFDFAASFREAFDNIDDVITNFGEAAIANAPMIAICYASPLGFN